MNRNDFDMQCFSCTTLLGVIFMEQCFRVCYANDLQTTTCSGVWGHHTCATTPARCSYYK
jgi:hypothetical protein